MRIYCFEIDGKPDWSSGKPVPAVDRRTGHHVLLYGSNRLDTDAPSGRQQARTILERVAPIQNNGSSVHLFSYGQYIGLAAADERAASPVLKELRSAGLFPAPVVAPPPPPPLLCTKCGRPRQGTAPLCAACRQRGLLRKLLVAAAVLLVLVGIVLLAFRSRPKPLPSVGFSADSTRVARGQTALLSWHASDASSVSIDPGIGSVDTSGSRSVQIEGTTTYTLTASGPGGTVSQRVTIVAYTPKPPPIKLKETPSIETGPTETGMETPPEVPPQPSPQEHIQARTTPKFVRPIQEPPRQAVPITPAPSGPPTAQLVTNRGSFRAGDLATLTWTTTNATSVKITPGPGEVRLSGSWSTIVNGTTTYTLTATGPGGEISRSATLSVAPVIQSFTSQNASIWQGQRTTLRWQIAGTYTSLEVTESVIGTGTGCIAGQRSVYTSPASSAAPGIIIQPKCDAQYTLHVTSSAGTLDAGPVAVHVAASQTPAPYGQNPGYGGPTQPGSGSNAYSAPTSGNIVWTGPVNALSHRVIISWYFLRQANGDYVWRGVPVYSGGYLQQGATIFDPQGANFGNQVDFIPAHSSVHVVDVHYDAQRGLPRLTLTLNCDRAGQQTIVLRWAKRQNNPYRPR